MPIYRILFIILFFGVRLTVFSQEICHNGIDDDGDGQIDLSDIDCACYDTSSYPISFIPNHSFEDFIFCPDGSGQVHYAYPWLQATSATSDYFNCNYGFESLDSLGIAASDGTGFMGAGFTKSWKEYIGVCLTEPLLAGTLYQLEIDIAMVALGNEQGAYCSFHSADAFGSVNVTVYGTNDCLSLPQTNNYGCPTGNDLDYPSGGDSSWVILGEIPYSPSSTWQKAILNFIPTINVNAIMIGPPCDLPASFTDSIVCVAYGMFDNLILNTYSSFFFQPDSPIIDVNKNIDCQGEHYSLSMSVGNAADYYWVTPSKDTLNGETINIGLLGNDNQGIYSAYYISDNCRSEVADINLIADTSMVTGLVGTLPNIITPNGDGINDYFDMDDFTGGCLEYELLIWNRWGNMIFRQSNGSSPFMGYNNIGNKVVPGVYFYILYINGIYFKNTLTVTY